MQHWSVTVTVDGEELVCIESNCLSGNGDLTATDEAVIRNAAESLLNAAESLLSFVGAVVAPDTRCDDDKLPGTAADWREVLTDICDNKNDPLR